MDKLETFYQLDLYSVLQYMYLNLFCISINRLKEKSNDMDIYFNICSKIFYNAPNGRLNLSLV